MIWRRLLGAALIVIGVVALVHGLVGSSWIRWNADIFEFEWAEKWGWAGETFEMQRTVEVPATKRISIETTGANIELKQGGTDRIRVLAHGTIDSGDKERIRLMAEPSGDALKVEFDMPRWFPFGFGIRRATLTVELPPEQWEQIDLTARSGNVTIAGVAANGMESELGSGNLSVRDADVGHFRHHAGSGNATVTGIRAERVELSVGSGNVNVQEYAVEQIVLNGGSGNAVFIDGSGSLDGELGSGNFRLEADRLDRDVRLRTGSGNVRVELMQRPESLAVDFETGSGRGTVEWDGFAFEEDGNRSGKRLKGGFGAGSDGTPKLTVRTGSGNFTLE